MIVGHVKMGRKIKCLLDPIFANGGNYAAERPTRESRPCQKLSRRAAAKRENKQLLIGNPYADTACTTAPEDFPLVWIRQLSASPIPLPLFRTTERAINSRRCV